MNNLSKTQKRACMGEEEEELKGEMKWSKYILRLI